MVVATFLEKYVSEMSDPTRAALHRRGFGASLALYQVIVPAGDVYYIAYGQARAADAAEYMPEFRQVAHSLTLVGE